MSRVETTAVERYILRVSGHDAARVAYELHLITQLQHVPLPFVTPAPIPTQTGDLLLRLPDDGNRVAVLWPFVAGTHSMGNNRRRAEAAGRALAVLQRALRRVNSTGLPHMTAPPAAGELDQYHPRVGDPVATIDELPIDRRQKARLRVVLDAMLMRIAQQYPTLPQQLIHNDYDPSNVLFAGQRVTGVLDFEQSTVDVHAMDLAVALLWWPRAPRGSARSWVMMDAFGQGYARDALLTMREAEALPFLIQLRTIATLLTRIGWYRAGRNSEAQLMQRVQWTLAIDAWLTSAGAELRQRARTWVGHSGGQHTHEPQ